MPIWRDLRAKTTGSCSARPTNMPGSRPVASTVSTFVGWVSSRRSASSSPHASMSWTSTMWLRKEETLRMEASSTVASRMIFSLSSSEPPDLRTSLPPFLSVCSL